VDGLRLPPAAGSAGMSALASPVADLELLTRWRSGDNASGSALVKRHYETLHRFFSSKAPGHDEDLIQQTFVACIEARDAFRGESTFRAYLFGLARFQLLSHYRRVYRRPDLDFTITSLRDLGTSPTGALLRREASQLLQLALAQLPVDQQIALELTYWEGLGAPEVARVLDIPENTVYSRVRRAKEHLRKALEQLSDREGDRDQAFKLLAGED
jgi:RNA polymerase sigma factor (sigma-70 family)